MNKPNKKSVTQKSRWTATQAKLRKPAKVVGITLLAMFVAGQLFFDLHVFRSANPGQDATVIAGYIIDAIEHSSRPAALDPVSKKLYLPDANIVLPSTPPDIGDVRYNYVPAVDGTDAEASVTTNAAMRTGVGKIRVAASNGGSVWTYDPTVMFDEVPNAQVCARGIHVVFGTKTQYDALLFEKKLADGRTMKLYSERQRCSLNLAPLVAYLKSAESY